MGNEEANEIALLALRQVGCDLPEDCGGIEAFTTDILVSAPLAPALLCGCAHRPSSAASFAWGEPRQGGPP